MSPPKQMYPDGMGPPDGGYGWVVAAAYALNNIIVIPIIQNFGLVFRDLFKDLGISGTDTAVIMNTNNAFGLALGLFNGPILRTFSYRKVAMLGSLMVFIGVVLTSFARSFIEFLVFYGLIMSAGYNLTMASFAYAINSYFQKRRSMAMGFAMTVTGLGPVFMPLLISLAMREFGARATALLLGALSLHSFAGALLLQPVRWHLVSRVPDRKEDKEDEADGRPLEPPPAEGLEVVTERPEEEEEEKQEDAAHEYKQKIEDAAKEEADEPLDSRAPMLGRRRCSSVSHRSGLTAQSKTSSAEPLQAGTAGPLATSVWASMASLDSAALGGSFMALNADSVEDGHNGKKINGKGPHSDKGDAEAAVLVEIALWRRCLRAVVKFFDLGLLSDPVYVNIMLGLSFAVFAEINFSLFTPFILGDRHFDTQQIATLVSIIAVADIVFRFLAPFIKKAFKQPVRVMYMMGLVLLLGTRMVLIFCYSYESLIGVMVALGVAKGLRTVYWVLVIPDYVPIERLPAANGLQSVTNGIVFMALGPLMGLIRDKLGDYNYVIVAVNIMTTLTIIMWSSEFIARAVRRRRRGGDAATEKGKA